jgi:beta-phosphoglucomutase-like phosphatase (HAD superfamily)
MWVRQQWIEKTEFHDLSEGHVLARVLERCRELVKDGTLPVVVFDLDSTLFDVSGRTLNILKEWLEHPESTPFPETRERLTALTPGEMRYSLEDVWQSRKIPLGDPPYDHQLKHAKRFWKKRFFGNEYLVHDEPTPGAVEFVNALYRAGAMIVYLTGRDVPLMAFGTFDQLKSHGLPIEVERTRLILKPKRHLDDLGFKTGVARMVMGYGTVVASFENEPKNLVAMAQVFSADTMNVFIESVSSDHPAPVGKGIYRIREFRL